MLGAERFLGDRQGALIERFPNRPWSDSTWQTALERFAMSAPVPLRPDFDAALLRRLARQSRDPDQTRRPAGAVPPAMRSPRLPPLIGPARVGLTWEDSVSRTGTIVTVCLPAPRAT